MPFVFSALKIENAYISWNIFIVINLSAYLKVIYEGITSSALIIAGLVPLQNIGDRHLTLT